jgi:hypothetical protein
MRSDGEIDYQIVGKRSIRFKEEDVEKQVVTRRNARPEPRKSGWLSRFRRASG